MIYRAREKGVVGLGYVGLPLAVAFADAEVVPRAVGPEKDSEKMAVLDTYDSYVDDMPAERLQPLVASGKLQFAGDFRALRGAGAVVFCLMIRLHQRSTLFPYTALPF